MKAFKAALVAAAEQGKFVYRTTVTEASDANKRMRQLDGVADQLMMSNAQEIAFKKIMDNDFSNVVTGQQAKNVDDVGNAINNAVQETEASVKNAPSGKGANRVAALKVLVGAATVTGVFTAAGLVLKWFADEKLRELQVCLGRWVTKHHELLLDSNGTLITTIDTADEWTAIIQSTEEKLKVITARDGGDPDQLLIAMANELFACLSIDQNPATAAAKGIVKSFTDGAKDLLNLGGMMPTIIAIVVCAAVLLIGLPLVVAMLRRASRARATSGSLRARRASGAPS